MPLHPPLFWPPSLQGAGAINGLAEGTRLASSQAFGYATTHIQTTLHVSGAVFIVFLGGGAGWWNVSAEGAGFNASGRHPRTVAK